MMFRRVSCESRGDPRMRKDPLSDLSAAIAPKDVLKEHLRDHKANARSRHSEREILDAMDKLRKSPSDKEADDLLYALSDISPSEGVRRKARDMIAERNGK